MKDSLRESLSVFLPFWVEGEEERVEVVVEVRRLEEEGAARKVDLLF